jgi:hypothetical protein
MSWRTARDLQSRQRDLQFALAGALADLTEFDADSLRLSDGRSVRTVVAHLVLTEMAVLDDLHLMLTVDHPDLPSIARLEDPERLAALMARWPTLAELSAALKAACDATLALVETLDEEQEARTGHGPELGNVLLGSHAALNISYHYRGHVEELRALRQHQRSLA